jgi:hypothetical protein
MENSRLARHIRRMIVHNKAKWRRICDIESGTSQIKSCNNIQPIDSIGQSVT